MDDSLSTEFKHSATDADLPAYLRLRRLLRQRVENGALGPGHALPSERELAEQLSISRVTVRKAIEGLVEDGVLVQRRGAGTFVAERIIKPLSKMTSFTEDLRARGLDPRSVFLERAVSEVTPEEAMALNLSPGSQVVRLHRLRYAGDEPLALERSTIPHSLLKDPDSVVDSLYERLEELGYRPVRALQRLRAVNLNTAQAKQLHVTAGSAALLIERRSFLADGRLVEFTCSWYRGDTYDFVAELHGE